MTFFCAAVLSIVAGLVLASRPVAAPVPVAARRRERR